MSKDAPRVSRYLRAAASNLYGPCAQPHCPTSAAMEPPRHDDDRVDDFNDSAELWIVVPAKLYPLRETRLLLLEAPAPPKDPVLRRKTGNGRREPVTAAGG